MQSHEVYATRVWFSKLFARPIVIKPRLRTADMHIIMRSTGMWAGLPDTGYPECLNEPRAIAGSDLLTVYAQIR